MRILVFRHITPNKPGIWFMWNPKQGIPTKMYYRPEVIERFKKYNYKFPDKNTLVAYCCGDPTWFVRITKIKMFLRRIFKRKQ